MVPEWPFFNNENITVIILVGWPLAFLWLMRYTTVANDKREERLMTSNDKWRDAVLHLTDSINELTIYLKKCNGGGVKLDGKGSSGGTSGSEGASTKGGWGGLG